MGYHGVSMYTFYGNYYVYIVMCNYLYVYIIMCDYLCLFLINYDYVFLLYA